MGRAERVRVLGAQYAEPVARQFLGQPGRRGGVTLKGREAWSNEHEARPMPSAD